MAPFDHLLPLQERSGGCTVLTLQKKWQTFNYCLFIYFLHKKKWSTQTRKKQKTLCGDVTVAKGQGQVGSHVQGTIYLLNIETGERWSENDWLHRSTMSTTWSIQPSVSEGVGYSVLGGVARFRSLRSFWSIIDRVLLKVKQEVRHEQNEVCKTQKPDKGTAGTDVAAVNFHLRCLHEQSHTWRLDRWLLPQRLTQTGHRRSKTFLSWSVSFI